MMYAIHKRTKHHVAITDWNHDFWHYYIVTFCEDWNFKKATPDGWIEWQGGRRPLPKDAPCEMKLRDGEIHRNQLAPEDAAWEHDWFDADIIAYRPILDTDTKPEPPAWDGEGLPPVGCECEVSIENGTYRVCKVIAYHEDMMWLDMKCAHPVRLVDRCNFRPIRSEEDKAIDAMREIFKAKIGTDESIYEALYHAIRDGKIPGVRLDD